MFNVAFDVCYMGLNNILFHKKTTWLQNSAMYNMVQNLTQSETLILESSSVT